MTHLLQVKIKISTFALNTIIVFSERVKVRGCCSGLSFLQFLSYCCPDQENYSRTRRLALQERDQSRSA